MKTYRNTAARESFAASPITCSRGDYAFLSNFYPAPVCYRGNLYANNEAAFQAQKTLSAKEQRVFYLPYLKDRSRKSKNTWPQAFPPPGLGQHQSTMHV